MGLSLLFGDKTGVLRAGAIAHTFPTVCNAAVDQSAVDFVLAMNLLPPVQRVDAAGGYCVNWHLSGRRSPHYHTALDLCFLP